MVKSWHHFQVPLGYQSLALERGVHLQVDHHFAIEHFPHPQSAGRIYSPAMMKAFRLIPGYVSADQS
jgi:hypothetical protein